MDDISIVILIIVGAVILFVQNRLPVVIVALAVPFALFMTGVLSLQEAFAGFGDPTVIFIATLFVVSAGLEAAGVTAWVGQKLIAWAGTESRARLVVFTILVVAGLTAMISVNGAVAALLPVVVVMAIRTRTSPSQLLMPLAFGAHCGSLLTLSGTPVSVLVNDALIDAGGEGFAYFEFAWVGLPLLIGGSAIMVALGHRLLPQSQGPSLPSDFSAHAAVLSEQYRLGDVVRLRLREGSRLVGTRIEGLALDGEVRLMEVGRGRDRVVDGVLAAGDTLLVAGPGEAVAALAGKLRLGIEADGQDDSPFTRNSGLAEVVIPPRSRLIGERAWPGMPTKSGEMVVLAVQRGGEPLGPAGGTVRAGDTLLLQGSWQALEKELTDPAVLVVDSPAVVRRQAVPLGLGARTAILTLVAMVAMLAFDLVAPAIAGLVAATAMILSRLVSVEEAYRAINWTTIILVGAMMPLSTAMFVTGAAQLLADGLVAAMGEAGPTALLVGLFLICAILGQVISNTATALIVIPVAVLAAGSLGLNPTPVLMSLNIACAASFLTPIATPVNLMVMGPAGYRFTDYWPLGSVMMLFFFLVAVFWVPVVWPF